MAKETAEQKLLKLIEAADGKDGKSAAPQGGAAVAVASPAGAGAPVQQVYDSVRGIGVSTAGVPAFLQNILAMLQQKSAQPKTVLGLKDLNKLLVAAVALVVVFLVMDVLRGWQSAQRDVTFEEDRNIQQTAVTLPTFKDISEYVQAVTRRNIFQPYEQKEVVADTATALPVDDVTKRLEGLKLVGISWLDTPESATVMIEDEKTSVTYFLKQGEELRGFKVKTIYSDRVVISYQDETITVNL